MHGLILVVFALTYAGMAAGRVPGLRLDRTGIALLAVAILLGAGAIDTAFVGRAVDGPTLLLLFALMVISAQFALAGFYDLCAAHIVRSPLGPRRLLALTILVGGALSAILVNDIVVFAMTPLLIDGLRRRGLDPRPYLLGLAAASNAGSAATVIGNPQNILLGQVGGLGFWEFLGLCGLPAAVSLAAVYALIARAWRAELVAVMPGESAVAPETIDQWQITKGLASVVALVVLLSVPVPREVGAVVLAAVLLASRKMASRAMLGAVDWHLLVLFACLFTITAAVAETSLATDVLAWLAAHDLVPDRLAVLAPLALVLSNTIGNVPAVVLITAFWPALPHGTLVALALLSTLAGNLLLVGSIANLIVAERAATNGVALRFRDFARAGIPLTLMTLAIAGAWLLLIGQISW